jgi:hypothetical protein
VKIVRNAPLDSKIVVLDGISGTGKTMFSKIIGAFEGMQVGQFDNMFEWLQISAGLGLIEIDVAEELIKYLVDQKLYDSMISREVNFRPTDLSSVLSNPTDSLKYIGQLFMPDGQDAFDRILRENPSLFLITHQLFEPLSVARSSFGDRLRIIESVRHPFYLIHHWEVALTLFGETRDFSLVVEQNDIRFPWWANSWCDEFLTNNITENSVKSICSLMEPIINYTSSSTSKSTRYIQLIPFEFFVLEPNKFICEIELFLEKKPSETLGGVLIDQKIPRSNVSQGKRLEIYDRYGANELINSLDSYEQYLSLKKYIQGNCSKRIFGEILEVANWYEDTFGVWF